MIQMHTRRAFAGFVQVPFAVKNCASKLGVLLPVPPPGPNPPIRTSFATMSRGTLAGRAAKDVT
jgi:hypothetical protein